MITSKMVRPAVLLSALSTLTVPSLSVPDGCTINSINQVASVLTSCTIISVGSFIVPAANQPLIMNLQSGTSITFTGVITFDKNQSDGYLIEFIGNDCNIYGSTTHLFDGQGDQYWGTSTKPTLVYVKGNNTQLKGLSLKNCPQGCVVVDESNNLLLSSFLIDNKAGAGFNVAKSQYVTIRNSLVYNQDDCVVINNGNHMLIDNVNCHGGHGFKIATGVSTNDVALNTLVNITFANSKLNGVKYGLAILTCTDGGTGYIDNVNYKNIQITNATDYGIMIQQDFSCSAQNSTGTPVGNVLVSTVTYTSVTGVMTGNSSYVLSFRCAADGCRNVFLNDVTITGGVNSNECWNYVMPNWC